MKLDNTGDFYQKDRFIQHFYFYLHSDKIARKSSSPFYGFGGSDWLARTFCLMYFLFQNRNQ